MKKEILKISRMLLCTALALTLLFPALAEEELPEGMLAEEEILTRLLDEAERFAVSGEQDMWTAPDGTLFCSAPESDVNLMLRSEKSGAEMENITGADLTDSPDARGLKTGDPLSAVLAAYPLEDPELKGSEYMAVMYLDGTAEEGYVRAGYLVREGDNVTACVYTSFTFYDDGTVTETGVRYDICADTVDSITVYSREADRDETLYLLEELADCRGLTEFVPVMLTR